MSNTFTEDQEFIFNGYTEGKNVFITGPGGCGKSHVIKSIVEHAKFHNKRINVCAMTGCAAVLLNCGAKTLHSWAGIGLAKGDDNVIITNISSNKYKKRNWMTTDVLIIDEVSMMSKRLFNLLDSIGKRIRRNSKPFGGIQLIFSGDFYQLPPVGDRDNPDNSKFCFESELWDDTFDYQILLDKVFRQTNMDYIDVLQQVREGVLYNSGLKLLNSRLMNNLDDLNNEDDNEEIKPVILHPTKKNVNEINKYQMDNLSGETYKYTYEVEPNENIKNMVKPTITQQEYEVKYMVNNSLFEQELVLKVGTQVMCIANINMDLNICNGTTGVITEFKKGFPYVKLDNGQNYLFIQHTWNSENYPISIKQIPLIHAWAITIHKSQGATLEKAQINLGSSVFTYGQSYVALSRVKSLEGLYITNFNPQRIKANPFVKEFYKRFYDDGDENGDENENGEEVTNIKDILEASRFNKNKDKNKSIKDDIGGFDIPDLYDIEYDTEGYVY